MTEDQQTKNPAERQAQALETIATNVALMRNEMATIRLTLQGIASALNRLQR